MRKVIPAFLISIFLLLTLMIFVSGPISAQEPDIPPPKGVEELPPTQNSDSPLPISIDRALLPKIEPRLLKKLLTESEPVPFIVYLKATTDLSAAVVSASPAIGAQGGCPSTAGCGLFNWQATHRTSGSHSGPRWVYDRRYDAHGQPGAIFTAIG